MICLETGEQGLQGLKLGLDNAKAGEQGRLGEANAVVAPIRPKGSVRARWTVGQLTINPALRALFDCRKLIL